MRRWRSRARWWFMKVEIHSVWINGVEFHEVDEIRWTRPAPRRTRRRK